MRAEFYLNTCDKIVAGGYYDVMDDMLDIYDLFLEIDEKRVPMPASVYDILENDLVEAAEREHRAYLEDSAEIYEEYFKEAI